MKKKIFLVSVLIMMLCTGLFILTGCGKNTSNNENNNSEKNSTENNSLKAKDNNTVTIGDKIFKFDKQATFKEFSYKNADGLKPDESQMAVYLDYKNNDIYNGKFVFRIAMSYKENMSLKDVEDQYKGKNFESKKINELNWIAYKSNSNNTDTIVYITEKNNNLYVVNLGKYEDCNIDINSLAEVFMNGVTITTKSSQATNVLLGKWAADTSAQKDGTNTTLVFNSDLSGEMVQGRDSYKYKKTK